jgi:tetratricopeptide (TPR) repeat protein
MKIVVKLLALVGSFLIRNCQYRGKLRGALAVANGVLQWMEIISGKWSAGYCEILKSKGFVYYLKGDNAKFLLYVYSALEITEQRGYESVEAGCLGVLGIYHQNTCHDLQEASGYYREAIGIQRSLGDKRSETSLLIHLGSLLKEKREFNESEKCFEDALAITNDSRLRINCHLELGRLFHAQSNLGQAKEEVNKALRLALHTQFISEQGDCYRQLARIAYEEGDKEGSHNFYLKALRIYDDYGYDRKSERLMKEMNQKFNRLND